MRDATIYAMFNALNKEVEQLKKEKNDIMLMRLQLDGVIRMIRLFPPIGWIFNLCFKKSLNIYKKKVEEHEKMMKQAAENLKKEKEERRKWDLPCSCGSLKKYRNCCGKDKVKMNVPQVDHSKQGLPLKK